MPGTVPARKRHGKKQLPTRSTLRPREDGLAPPHLARGWGMGRRPRRARSGRSIGAPWRHRDADL